MQKMKTKHAVLGAIVMGLAFAAPMSSAYAGTKAHCRYELKKAHLKTKAERVKFYKECRAKKETRVMKKEEKKK
jgi:hypothetical protein